MSRSVAVTAASLQGALTRFRCTWQKDGRDAAWVRVVGELDLLTSPQLELALPEAWRVAHMVVLDLREVTFADSSGVHVILDAARSARRHGGRLILVRGPSHVDRVFALTGAHEEMIVVDLDPREECARALSRVPHCLPGA